MRSKYAILMVFLMTMIFVSCSSAKSSTKLNLKVQSIDQKWGKLCERITSMMINTKNNKRMTIDVTVYAIGDLNIQMMYNGFYKDLMTFGAGKIIFSFHDSSSEFFDLIYKDFLILLIQENIRYDMYIQQQFSQIIPDKSIKIFLILIYKFSFDNLLITWDALDLTRYYNVYAIIHKSSGEFDIYRTAIEKYATNSIQSYLQKAKSDQFLIIQEVIKGDEFGYIRLVFYNNYPLSYVKQNSIIGADGNVINELSKKVNLPYLIMNDHTKNPSLIVLVNYMTKFCDINLYTHTHVNSNGMKTAWIYQMHGTCLLVPRNIVVSAYDNFSFPLDRATIIMSVISTISVIICWKLISNEMSLTAIIFALYELILNLGASGIDRITIRESFLVYCFIFSSFILVSFYESMFLSFMLAVPTWRSVSSLEELNQSNTMVYSFYDEYIARNNNLPLIRRELVMNYIDLRANIFVEVPDEFDNTLAYTVLCDYADYFLSSSRNYQHGRRLYDKITITPYYKTYNVNKGYIYADQFIEMVKQLMESGIYGFWSKQDLEANIENQLQLDSETDDFDMSAPLVLLIFGCSLAFLVLVFEIVSSKISIIQQNLKKLKVANFAPRKKCKLDKWKKKFMFTDKLKILFGSSNSKSRIPTKCQKDEQIVCRESVCGNYFVLKRIKRNRKIKQSVKLVGNRVVQVRPCNAESLRRSKQKLSK